MVRPDKVKKGPGGVIAAVEPGSLGAKHGLQPGDRLLAINNQRLRDIIDVQYYGAEEMLDLLLERNGEQVRLAVERDYDEGLGLAFENLTFDVDIRRCANNCDFCFVKQNARGMRRSLYIKDDDYRYSFLFGNFVTLTNLTDDDWAAPGTAAAQSSLCVGARYRPGTAQALSVPQERTRRGWPVAAPGRVGDRSSYPSSARARPE